MMSMTIRVIYVNYSIKALGVEIHTIRESIRIPDFSDE